MPYNMTFREAFEAACKKASYFNYVPTASTCFPYWNYSPEMCNVISSLPAQFPHGWSPGSNVFITSHICS